LTDLSIGDKICPMDNIQTPAVASKKKKVSFSQFSNWYKCRHRWYLDKVKGLSEFEDSIHTCFGTAIHEVVQLYVETLYTKGAKEADSHDLHTMFKEIFKRELDRAKANNTVNKSGEAVVKVKQFEFTDVEFKEFCADGDNILDAFINMTNRIKYFPTGKFEFVSVEDEIQMPIKHNVEFVGFIDIVLKEKATGRYRIIDLKTSTQGWNKYQKEDPAKTSQILLYKAFFSRKYNVPIEMIDIEFFILKRRLYENYAWPQSRIETFVPTNHQRAVAGVLNTFSEFITESFKPDGSYIDDVKVYLKNPGKAKKNCKYCPHKKIACDTKSDIPLSEL